MSIEQVREQMNKLADKLNEFRTRYNHYPTDKDFKNKLITPSKPIYYKVFGDMEKATDYAEDLWIQERFKPRKKRIRRSFREKHEGFPCSCCGTQWEGAYGFYSILRKAISNELTRLKNECTESSEVILGLSDFLFGTGTGQHCWCGGEFKPHWTSSFKIIVSARLSDLLKTWTGLSPIEATRLCQEAIFGKSEEINTPNEKRI